MVVIAVTLIMETMVMMMIMGVKIKILTMR